MAVGGVTALRRLTLLSPVSPNLNPKSNRSVQALVSNVDFAVYRDAWARHIASLVRDEPSLHLLLQAMMCGYPITFI